MKKFLQSLERIWDWLNARPFAVILVLIVFIVMMDVIKQINRPLKFKDGVLHLSKKETEKVIKNENLQITETLQKIDLYIYKIDSCNNAIDSIQFRKRSKLDTLQSWYRNYRQFHSTIDSN